MGPAACGEKQVRPGPWDKGSSGASSSPSPKHGGPGDPGAEPGWALLLLRATNQGLLAGTWLGTLQWHFQEGTVWLAVGHMAVTKPIPVPCPLSQASPPVQTCKTCQASQYESINVCALSITLLHPQGQI